MTLESTIDARYRKLFGYRAGYLPRDRNHLDEWQRHLMTTVNADGDRPLSNAVLDLESLLASDAIVRMYVDEMIAQVPARFRSISTSGELIAALDHISSSAPTYNSDPAKLNAHPMTALFAYMMMTPAGAALFRVGSFNEALRRVLKAWCLYLDCPDSAIVLNEGAYGWLSPFAYQDLRLYEFVCDRSAPHWGWSSYNDFFHRAIRKELRPIAGPHDSKVIVSSNDGFLVSIARGVHRIDRFWLKGEPFSLTDMLAGSTHVDRFLGGYVVQSFLSSTSYHRWHAPVDGIVTDALIVEGLMFSEAESAGIDPTARIRSEGYDACVNTRGLIFIQSHDRAIGMVCVMPIGITDVSSIAINVEPGDAVAKGDELGFFNYGGSSMCLLFEQTAISHFVLPAPPLPGADPLTGAAIKVNAPIAIAN